MSNDIAESSVPEGTIWVENVEQEYTTKKFAELLPGVYMCTPLRRINTKFGKQLICNICTPGSTESAEYFVPNSFINQIKNTCGDVEHKCMLKLISNEVVNKIPKYKFLIGKLKDNPVVSIERPIQESLW